MKKMNALKKKQPLVSSDHRPTRNQSIPRSLYPANQVMKTKQILSQNAFGHQTPEPTVIRAYELRNAGVNMSYDFLCSVHCAFIEEGALVVTEGPEQKLHDTS